ncbi:MAG: S-layer homology domain-containing protein [Clostridia bacterium]|nr:S-layer homology domain-containing protein [Clostridia bacterium]
MKKIMSLALVMVLICISTIAYADFRDIPQNAAYTEAANRLNSLGIIPGATKDAYKPQEYITRELFAVIMVKATGLTDTADSLKGSTIFPDVDPKSSSSGYIALAVEKGYVPGMPDGRFQPKAKITFAQVCTATVRALGYTDQDVTGLWPKNYIEKAAKLGLTEGIKLKSSDSVEKWALALMIDRLLDTNIKKIGSAETDKSFAEASGLFTQCIVYANSAISDKLQENQVMTDRGIFYLKSKNIKLELGKTYRLVFDGDTINAAYDSSKTVENISVDNIVETRISYNSGEEIKYRTLPNNTAYYYQGVKQPYENLKNIIKTRSSLVFTYNKNKTGYEYAVIFDPVYSKPEVAKSFDPSSKRLGSIDLSGNITVVRDGTLSDITLIQEKDVIYKVSDIWNRYSYILALNKRVGGKITAILPDKLSPKTLQIDGINYEFDQSIEYNKLNYTPGSFNIDDIIVALLGYDGKIVALDYPGSENNSDYALVLNSSNKVSSNNNGTVNFTYYAKLLTADGLTITYDVGSDASQYKGKLVRFTKIDSQKVKLEQFVYNFPKGLYVDKKTRNIGTSYVADNVRIFNIVSNDAGVDVQANLLDFGDLPEGAIPDGKVYFINKAGAFEDINVLLTDDLLNEKYKTAVIKSLTVTKNPKGIYSYNYTLLVDGKDYQYSESYINDSNIGSVVKVKMSEKRIETIVDNKCKNADVSGTSVQAFDSKRIKLNEKTLWFNKNITVYFLDYAGNLTHKSLADLSANVMYGTVSVYLDKPVEQGGKVEVIIVKQ